MVAAKEEGLRLAALQSCAVMYTPREAAFDSIVYTVAQLFRVPIALLVLIDDKVAWAKALVGPMAKERLRDDALCTHVVQSGRVLIVEDASIDARFAHMSILQADPPLRFFAGAPLFGPARQAVGTLAVYDRHPRSVPERQQTQLVQLAQEAGELLRLRVPGLDLSA